MRRGIFVLIVVICVTLTFAVQAFSMGQRPPAKKTEADKALQVSGKITEIDLKNLTLMVTPQIGESVKLKLSEKTIVTKAGGNISIAGLKKGVQVTANYQVNLGRKIAYLIVVLEQPKVAPKTAPVKGKK